MQMTMDAKEFQDSYLVPPISHRYREICGCAAVVALNPTPVAEKPASGQAGSYAAYHCSYPADNS